MQLTKIKISDFKKYKHELILTVCYTLALLAVYSSWSFSVWHKFWLSALIAVLFVIAGAIVYYFWVMSLKTKDEKNNQQD